MSYYELKLEVLPENLKLSRGKLTRGYFKDLKYWEVDGQWVSSCTYKINDNTAFIYNVKTKEEHRHKGYAQSMLYSLIKKDLKKYEDIRLFVYQDNAPARGLYKKLGFKPLPRAYKYSGETKLKIRGEIQIETEQKHIVKRYTHFLSKKYKYLPRKTTCRYCINGEVVAIASSRSRKKSVTVDYIYFGRTEKMIVEMLACLGEKYKAEGKAVIYKKPEYFDEHEKLLSRAGFVPSSYITREK